MTTENLYSIVLDFRGGTYIAQVSKASPEEAVVAWADALSETDARAWNLNKEQLGRIAQEESLVALTGCENVWCLSGSIGNHLVLVNVIQTARV